MARRTLVFRFIDSGAAGTVQLHDDQAPGTCAAIWRALEQPRQIRAVHAMFAGPEIMLGLPPEAQGFDPRAIPVENQTCFPSAGDCLWFYQAKGMMKGLTDELWEIGLFYADGGRIFGPLGWTPCNIFGRMVEGLDAFAAACADIRLTGAKMLELRQGSAGAA
ncbi:MAG TPA: DUF3830 family protein [Acetobacteraceae bacterium]|nr:DUF3830 family protein [Acetobacteraceae bacterium]